MATKHYYMNTIRRLIFPYKDVHKMNYVSSCFDYRPNIPTTFLRPLSAFKCQMISPCTRHIMCLTAYYLRILT